MKKQTLNPAIAGAYQNATALYNGVVREVYGVNINCVALFTETDEFECVEHEECQLILTPLSKISGEDAVEVCKLLYNNPSLHNAERGRIVATTGDWHSTRKGVAIIDFLRSRGYDCGYGSIPSLIQVGIAVDGTLLTDKK